VKHEQCCFARQQRGPFGEVMLGIPVMSDILVARAVAVECSVGPRQRILFSLRACSAKNVDWHIPDQTCPALAITPPGYTSATLCSRSKALHDQDE